VIITDHAAQLRDDLMTMLIAGHETTAAVLTWTVYCLSQHPQHLSRLQQEVRMVWLSPSIPHSRLSRNLIVDFL